MNDTTRTSGDSSPSRFLRIVVAVAALLVSAASAGCRETSSEMGRANRSAAEPTVAAVGAVATGSTMTVTDRFGRRVDFSTVPQRIVSLSPSLTEILFAIGAGERIVGATQYCDYPPAAQQIARVGGGTLESLNQETIVSLEPDLVLCKGDTHEPLLRNLERLEIPVLALGPETMAELLGHTRMLGQLTGQSQQAEELVESMQQRIAAVTARIPEGVRPTVFYEVWDEPLMTAGPRSYIGELLTLAGARNLFEETEIRYPKISPEAVVARNPDVILAPAWHAAPVTIESFRARPGWSQVRAVREKRVYVIDHNHISRCGPRLVNALEEIVGLLYPDHFPSATRESQATAATNNAAAEGQVGAP